MRRQAPPLRSQWRCFRPIVIIGVGKYVLIFADPKMSRLARMMGNRRKKKGETGPVGTARCTH